jgi:hypothetical protein
MKVTSAILVNILFIVGISLETTAAGPETFTIEHTCWTPRPPQHWAAAPEKWMRRTEYIPGQPAMDIGKIQDQPHLRLYPVGDNQFEIYNTLRTPHLVIMFDHARLRWLELQLKVDKERLDGTVVPRRYKITSGKVTIYTEEGLET